MPQIMPIKDLKDTSYISEVCHKSEEPIFITKNGYGDMVIMSIELYEATQKKLAIYNDIELSEHQIIEGKTKNAREALIPEMDYRMVFRIADNDVYIVGLFHDLEDYVNKVLQNQSGRIMR